MRRKKTLEFLRPTRDVLIFTKDPDLVGPYHLMRGQEVVAFVNVKKLDEDNAVLGVNWRTLANLAIMAQAMKKPIRGQQLEAGDALNIMCICQYKSPVAEYQTPLLRMLKYGSVVTFGFLATDRDQDNNTRVIGGVFNPETMVRVEDTPVKFPQCTETTAAFLTEMLDPNPLFPAKTEQSNEADTACNNDEDEDEDEDIVVSDDEAQIGKKAEGSNELTTIITSLTESASDDDYNDDEVMLQGGDSEN